MARNNLNVVKTSARQDEISLDEEVIMTVNDFNIQQNMITSAEEALDLSILAYNETRQRFIIGKADINSLTLSPEPSARGTTELHFSLAKLLAELL